MKFALAGNPNSGKTTLFNALTGSTAHVGNWPGVTVDKKTGFYKKFDNPIEIIDLPGIYSLSPYTPEEVISRNYILDEKPDLVIDIVDATNIERNLYLTTQLMEIDVPVVVALNFMDEVEKIGDKINVEEISKKLGVPIVEISALKGTGITKLMDVASHAAKKSRKGKSVLEHSSIDKLFAEVLKLQQANKVDNSVYHAVKMIEEDILEVESHSEMRETVAELKKTVDSTDFDGDFEAIVADARYKYICEHISPYFKRSRKFSELTKSDKIDRVMTHKIWSIPLFFAIMLLVFHLTFSENLFMLGLFIPEGSFDLAIIGTDAINSPGVMLFNAVEMLTGWLGDLASSALPEGVWYTALICDALLGGLFAVLSFVPQIMVLFLFISILEESGYMSRVAFIMDRVFRKFGLSGKAFMPLIMCFGCAVPGIMATRTLNNEHERKRTIMLTPFFSCGAKLPIWAAFAGVFSQIYSGLNAEIVVFSMYFLGIGIAVVASLFLKKTAIKGEAPTFIMELPAYHRPQFRNTMVFLWQKLKHYIFRAATVIAGSLVVIWFLSSFSFTLQFVEDSADSIIGIVAQGLRYLFIPLGFGMGEDGWKFVVAAITGLIAKEMVVATMGTFAGIDGDEALEMEGDDIANTALGAMMLGIGGVLGGFNMAIPAMFSFMAFNLLAVPCMAAVAAARAELKNKKLFWFSIGFWMGTAYLVSLAIFWYGAFWTVCWWAALLVGVLAVATAIAVPILKARGILKGKHSSLATK